MASIGHIAVGMAAARLFPLKRPARWPLAAHMFLWSSLSMLPDLDVVGFRFGIRYADAWGHRGATHSLAFALLVGFTLSLVSPLLGTSRVWTALCVTGVVASHALLDTLTDGGLGCALFWPFDPDRYFAPWRPIPVARIGRAYFGQHSLRVISTELAIFLPFLIYALWPRSAPRANRSE
jgi:inner membrane protein